MCHVAIYVQSNINKYVWLSTNLIPLLVTTEHSLAPKNVTSTLGWHCSGIFWGGSSDTSLCHVYIFCELVFTFSFIFCSTQWRETHLIVSGCEAISVWWWLQWHIYPFNIPSSCLPLHLFCWVFQVFGFKWLQRAKKRLFKPFLHRIKKTVTILVSLVSLSPIKCTERGFKVFLHRFDIYNSSFRYVSYVAQHFQ